MITSKSAFVDSNVLVYAALKDSEHFRAASVLRQHAQNGEIQLYITPQILAEFFAVITDPRRVSDPRSAQETLDEIEKYCATPSFVLVGTSAESVSQLVTLCRRHPVKAQEIFDLQIVATMLIHGIRTIYTFNKKDFEKFEEIKVIVPA